MAPTSKGSPSTGSTTRTSVRRLRTRARRPSDTGLRWRTMAIAAGTSRGSRDKRKPSASTPPAYAPIVMMLRRIRSVLITSRPPSCGYGSLRRPLPPRGCCRWRTAGPPPGPRTAIPAPGGISLRRRVPDAELVARSRPGSRRALRGRRRRSTTVPRSALPCRREGLSSKTCDRRDRRTSSVHDPRRRVPSTPAQSGHEMRVARSPRGTCRSNVGLDTIAARHHRAMARTVHGACAVVVHLLTTSCPGQKVERPFKNMAMGFFDARRPKSHPEQQPVRLEPNLGALPFAAFVVDLDGMVTAWNRLADKVFGVEADAAIGRKLADLLVVEPMTTLVEHVRRVLSTRVPTTLPEMPRAHQGQTVRLSASALIDDAARVVGCLVGAEDLGISNALRRAGQEPECASDLFVALLAHE